MLGKKEGSDCHRKRRPVEMNNRMLAKHQPHHADELKEITQTLKRTMERASSYIEKFVTQIDLQTQKEKEFKLLQILQTDSDERHVVLKRGD